MIKTVFHIINDKLWTGISQNEKKRLSEMLFASVIILTAAIINQILSLKENNSAGRFIFDTAVVMTSILAVSLVINGRQKYFINLFFTVPLFIYIYFTSEFPKPQALHELIQLSVVWLLAGTFLVMLFSGSDSKIIAYGVISLITILIELLKSNYLLDIYNIPFSYYNHPVFVYLIIFSGTFILTYRHKKLSDFLYDKIMLYKNGIAKIFRDTEFPAAVVRSDNDEEGNILTLTVEKVNNAFESAFNINNYEIKDQEANFIFNLVLKENFDLNNILMGNRKSKEIFFRKLDKWYKINVVKPYSNKFYVILEDITRNKRKTADLEYSKQRYKVLLEAIPDIFFVIGKDGIYEDFVIKESDLFKIENTNIIGNSIFDVGFPKNMADKIYQCIQNCLNNNTIEIIEYSLKTPNGTYIFEMRLAKLNSDSVISVARDITRRKNAEFSLEKAREKAEESDRLKSVFLANLSHEIRTPLNIIINFTRMLIDSEPGYNEKADIANAIQQNGTQLLNIINNTIHLSEIETGSIDISLKFCEINNLIRDLHNHFKPLIPDGRDVKIKLSPGFSNPSFGFITDQKLLKETLKILLDNAVKYTLRGEINIGYEILRGEVVKFIVSDTGIGIPSEELENIFSRFYRIKNEINDITAGSGIGLPVAKHYVAMLGGELQIDSEPEKGTVGWFSLPFKEGQGYLRVVS